MSSYQNLIVECAAGVARVTINRPRVLNALNWDTLTDLETAFAALAADAAVRAVIVTGAGAKAFVVGADIAALQALPAGPEGLRWARRGQAVFAQIERFPKPVIMAINGYALGGGCELALTGDLRIAAASARFGQPEITLGISPGWGGTQRLPRLVGQGRAKRLILTGEIIDAQEAWRIGLVEQVVPDAQLLAECEKLAQTLAGQAPIALRLAKLSIDQGLATDLASGCALEAACFGLECDTEDRLEGTQAFLEKRSAAFTGR
jgi:enoyl-CoA hydratase